MAPGARLPWSGAPVRTASQPEGAAVTSTPLEQLQPQYERTWCTVAMRRHAIRAAANQTDQRVLPPFQSCALSILAIFVFLLLDVSGQV